MLGSLHLDELPFGGRLRYRNPVLLEAIDMEGNRLTDEADHFVPCFADSHATGKIGHVGPPARISTLDHYHVSRHSPASRFLRPACLRIELRVPGGTTRLGFPATVTVPGLLGFLNWR